MKITEIYDTLRKLYPDAHCTLEYETPLQLLVATILAAQCTDARVNTVTPGVFARYPAACDLANADVVELEGIIRSTGFYRNKAANIIACCRKICEEYNGEVPHDMRDLVSLPGVGRKTANVIRGEIWGEPAVVIDTHAKRLLKRMGLTELVDPTKIEMELMRILPPEISFEFCHLLVYHGRAVCQARKPICGECPLGCKI